MYIYNIYIFICIYVCIYTYIRIYALSNTFEKKAEKGLGASTWSQRTKHKLGHTSTITYSTRRAHTVRRRAKRAMA